MRQNRYNSIILMMILCCACSSSYEKTELINSISDTISNDERYNKAICGDFSEVLRGDLNQHIKEDQFLPELKELHEELLEYQAQGITDNIPADYNNFLYNFKSKSYRLRLHSYLLSLQTTGEISGFTRHFDAFTNKYINFEWNEYQLEVDDISILKIGILQSEGKENSYLPVRVSITGSCMKMSDDQIFEQDKITETIEFQMRKNEYDEWQAISRDFQ